MIYLAMLFWIAMGVGAGAIFIGWCAAVIDSAQAVLDGRD